MNIFYVYQNKTYKFQSRGGYLWSPQKAKNGNNNIGYTNMGRVKKGDIIFHGAKQYTYAISIASTDCYNYQRPKELKNERNKERWNEIGYRVDSNYMIMKTPLDMKKHFKWFGANHKKDSAFTTDGSGKEVYLSNLDVDHAEYILRQLLALDQDITCKCALELLIKEIFGDDSQEYNDIELGEISNIIESDVQNQGICWQGEKLEKEFTIGAGAGKPKPKRKAEKAANALFIARYLCEYNSSHKVFLRKDGKTNYTEPHHLIPLSKHEDFIYNLDVEENIVSLCSHCHNLLHYGRIEDKEPILKDLYNRRKQALVRVGLELDSFEKLCSYYT